MKIRWEGLCPHCNKQIDLVRDLPQSVINEIRGFQGVTNTVAPPKATPATEKEPTGKPADIGVGKNGRDLSLIKTHTDLSKAVHEDFGVQPADTLKELGDTWAEITQSLTECYLQIQATHGK